MAVFDVRFLQGARVQQRQVQAADAQAAGASVGVAAGHVLSVQPVVTGTNTRMPANAKTEWINPLLQNFRAFPLRLFSQELAVLLGAGVPLLEALVTLREKEGSHRVVQALSAVIGQLEVGASFSQAVAARPQDFDALFAAVVAAAERSGQLRTALVAHARYLAWTETLRARLVGAAIYPALLVTASAAVLVFLLVFVVPRFGALLDGAAVDMPSASRLLLQAGQWAGDHATATALLALALLLLPPLALSQPAAQQALARLLWRLPGLGERLRVLALARLFRTLAMLLDAGVATVPALRTARAVAPEPLALQLDAVVLRVARGERLSASLDAEGLCTPVSSRMLRVGERSGEVANMLAQAAAFYDEELQRLSDWVTRLVNPLLMLVMGALIGSVVVMLYLPIFQLAEQVQ